MAKFERLAANLSILEAPNFLLSLFDPQWGEKVSLLSCLLICPIQTGTATIGIAS